MAFDIFKLRPTDTTSASIREALGRAVSADAQLAEELRQAKSQRDSMLLDGTPAALKGADAEVVAAADAAERVSTIKATLETRLAAAIEAETITEIEIALGDLKASVEAHAKWWNEVREVLAERLTAGSELKNAQINAYHHLDRLIRRAAQTHPHVSFDPLDLPSEAGDWQRRVRDCAVLGDFSYLSAGRDKAA